MKNLCLLCVALFVFGCASTPAEIESKKQREVDEIRQNELDGLRRKFARYSTEELHLMRARYLGLAFKPSKDINISVDPLATAILGDSDTRQTKQVIDIERELLRRYNAGDKEAYFEKARR